MLFKKKIVVTIGYSGTIIAFHNKNSVYKKFFFEKFDAESTKKIEPFFKSFKRASVSILLDTVDQTYKRKSFPSVRKGDLKNLARRELGGVSNKESLKSFIPQAITQEKSKSGRISKQWDTILITVSLNEEINKWIDFLFEMPNMIEGIYTAPIESFNIVKKIEKTFLAEKEREAKKKKQLEKKEAKGKKKDKKHKSKNTKDSTKKPKENENKIKILVTYSKVNGFRQVIFTKHGIEFSRIVNYDIAHDDFLKNYEQDIYSSYEYLKRSFSDIKITDIEVITQKLAHIETHELKISSYTPSDAARILGMKEGIIAKGSDFSDILLSRSLFKFKKLIKFKIPKMIAASKMYAAMLGSYYLYLFLTIFFFVEFLVNINIKIDFDKKIDRAEIEMFKATENLHKIQNKLLNTTNDESKNIDIEQAIDIGKINDILGKKSDHIFKLYDDFKYIKKYDVVLSRYSYFDQDYKEASPQKQTKYNITLGGKVYNESGNIDDLFTEFDNIDRDSSSALKGHKIRFSKISRNIDFNKKYYEFPLDFTISSK